MISLLAVLDVTFEPAFVFPGEKFRVITSAPAKVSAASLKLVERKDGWHGFGPLAPVEIYATIGPEGDYTDAAMKVLPVAKATPIAKMGALEVVPMHGELYGAIIGNKRFPSMITFSLAPRSAPERDRPFRINYIYVGRNHVSLAGDAGGLISATVHIEPGRLTFQGVPLFEFRGSINLLGMEHRIDASPGGRVYFSVTIPNSGP